MIKDNSQRHLCFPWPKCSIHLLVFNKTHLVVFNRQAPTATTLLNNMKHLKGSSLVLHLMSQSKRQHKSIDRKRRAHCWNLTILSSLKIHSVRKRAKKASEGKRTEHCRNLYRSEIIVKERKSIYVVSL